MHGARTRVLDPFRTAVVWPILAAAALVSARADAQDAEETPLFTPEELEELVAPIALYPDDLIAIVLPASTYPLDVVEAARFLDERENDESLTPDEEWDDSIVALLNYPEVLRLMDEDLDWTWDLGEAFLNQQAEVFDAIQRFRAQAREAGNLTSDARQTVTESDGAIRIAPADPKVIYVPYYEPRRIIVHHHVPIHYYPRPYPVYYYPYPAGYSFWSGYFWGVTTAFVIGWHTHHLHAHHHLHIGHPYYRHHYYDPFYVRRSISINIVNIDRDVYVWQPRHHRIGGRPGRVSVTREGIVRADYGVRRYVSRGDGSRRTVSAGGNAARGLATSSERTIGRVAGSERRAVSARGAARDGASTGARIATRARGSAHAGGRVTTRDGIVDALRDAGDRSRASGAAQGRASGAAQRSSRSSATIGGIASPRATSERSRRALTERSTPSRTVTRGSTSGTARQAAPTTRSNLAAPRSGPSAAGSSRGTVRSSRSAVSSGRSAIGSGRSAVSSGRSAVSSGRSAASSGRNAASVRLGAVRSTRSTAPRSAATSSRATSSRSVSRNAGATSRSSRSVRAQAR